MSQQAAYRTAAFGSGSGREPAAGESRGRRGSPREAREPADQRVEASVPLTRSAFPLDATFKFFHEGKGWGTARDELPRGCEVFGSFVSSAAVVKWQGFVDSAVIWIAGWEVAQGNEEWRTQ